MRTVLRALAGFSDNVPFFVGESDFSFFDFSHMIQCLWRQKGSKSGQANHESLYELFQKFFCNSIRLLNLSRARELDRT